MLGAGGFGITYVAFDHQLDGPVAIKEYFPADLAARADGERVAAAATTNRDVFAWGLDRFLDEARAIHHFRHPNVVRAHRYLEANGTAYIVMEYVEGESLKEILDRRGCLPAEEWRPWMNSLLEGLAHVHAHDYLHRDIKPANIVVRASDGGPLLIDFGSARVQQGDRTHTQVLTESYAPIEQYSSGATQSPPTDIYALAAVSYRVLTGDAAPSAPDRVLQDDYQPLVDRDLDADAGWLAAVDRGLALRPEDRPPNVKAWSTALGAARAPKPSAPRGRSKTVEGGESSPRQREVAKRVRGIVGRPLGYLAYLVGVYSYRWFWNGDAVAEAWFRRAANLGHPYGQAWTGWLAQGEDQAAGWFRKAAAQGLADAQVILAMMYAVGVGVQQDYSKARGWCRRAAERGDPCAQNILGIVHATAKGSLKDPEDAESWFLKAASPGAWPRHSSRAVFPILGAPRRRHSGLGAAQFNLARLYAANQRQRDASSWLHEAAKIGHAFSLNALGVMYATGRGVSRDVAEAEKWFNKARDCCAPFSARDALDQLIAAALYNLGAMCAERGDDVLARSHFQQSAEMSEPMAQSALGFLYAEGRTHLGEERKDDRLSYLRHCRKEDLEDAESWYRKAVDRLVALSRDGRPTATCPPAALRLGIPPFPSRPAWRGRTPALWAVKWEVPVQNGWGFMHAYPKGSEPGKSGPLAWFLKGANQGHAVAQHSLGRMYKYGWGVPADESKSLMWLRLAAKQGYAEAQVDLGRLYETGECVPRDYGEALKYYRRAAKRGNARAMRLLGRMCEAGDGVPVDKVAAASWYSVAAERGDRSAAEDLRRLSAEGWRVPEPYDEVEWLEWCRGAAEAGHAEAQAALGSRYADRYPAPPDYAKALFWYREAAEQGCARGQVGLAQVYKYRYKAGLDERQTETADFPSEKPPQEDLAEAAKWYRKAAEQEDADAEAALGSMYQDGEGVPKDEVEAVKWYRRAARQCDRHAQQRMGFAYEQGRGVRRDDAQAYAWFSLGDEHFDYELVERTLARLELKTEEERHRAHRLAAKYREDYVLPFDWRRRRGW